MSFVSLVCPNCGGKLVVDESKDSWVCEYCGSTVEREKSYVELSGNVNVNGIATSKTLLERGYMELEEGSFELARSLFERVLDADIRNSKAYIGRLLCNMRFINEEQLVAQRLPLTRYNDFEKALKYAKGSEKDHLVMLNERAIEAFEQDKAQFDKNVGEINKEISDQAKVMDGAAQRESAAKKIYKRFNNLKALYILAVVFSSIGTLGSYAIGAIVNAGSTYDPNIAEELNITDLVNAVNLIPKIGWVVFVIGLAMLIITSVFGKKSTNASRAFAQENTKMTFLNQKLNSYVEANPEYAN